MLFGVIFHDYCYLIIYNVFSSSSNSGHLAVTCVLIILIYSLFFSQKYIYCKGNIISDNDHRLECFQTRLSNWICSRFQAKKRNIYNQLGLIQRTRLI
jgi:hypothetical protein